MLYKSEGPKGPQSCHRAFNAGDVSVRRQLVVNDQGQWIHKEIKAPVIRETKKVMTINKQGKLEVKKVIDRGQENLYKRLPNGVIIDVKKYNKAIHKGKSQAQAIEQSRLN